MGKMVWVRSKKTTSKDKGWWPEKKKLEALTTYLSTGSISLTMSMTGVPETTLKRWRTEDWWNEHTLLIKQEETTQLDNKLSKILDKSLEAVMDRIQNGEFMYDPRSGEIRRVPAKLRDVQKVTSDLIDKKQLLNKKLQADDSKKQQVTADHLVQLANAFAQFASGGKPINAEKEIKSVIEGEATELFEAMDVETTAKDV